MTITNTIGTVGNALFLAPGERLIPWRLLLKTIDEVPY